MAMSPSGRSVVAADINVTPMIDVMLVLLIIFMIVTPLIAAGFKATLPKGKNLDPRPEGDNEVVLGIDEFGRYYLNKKPIRYEDIPTRLKQIYETRQEDKILYVKAHKDLQYSKVLDAMDLASKNGVRVVGMISDQRPGTKSTVAGDEPVPEKGGKP